MRGSNGKGKKVATQENGLNTISHGTVIKGDVHTKGDIRIEGHVVGNIKCDAKLVIGELGFVDGTVNARNAIISGKVEGTVYVHELLSLEAKARVEGDIFTQKLSVQVGADFTGNCQMGEEAKSASKNLVSEAEQISKGNIAEPAKRRAAPAKSIFSSGNRKGSPAKSPVNEQEKAAV